MVQTAAHKLKRQNRPKARAAAIARGDTGNVTWVIVIGCRFILFASRLINSTIITSVTLTQS